MKRHNLQYAVAGLGTILVIGGLVWACQRFVSTPKAEAQGRVTDRHISTVEGTVAPGADRQIRFAEHEVDRDQNLIPANGPQASESDFPTLPASQAFPSSQAFPAPQTLPVAHGDREAALLEKPRPLEDHGTTSVALRLDQDVPAPLDTPSPRPAKNETGPGNDFPATSLPASFPEPDDAIEPLALPEPKPMSESELPPPSQDDPVFPPFPAQPAAQPALELPAPNASPVNTFPTPAVANTPVANTPVADTPAADTPASEQAGTGVTGKGLPGPKQLEGPQLASVTLQKVLPDEVQVGRHETVTLTLRNEGDTIARNVQVRDTLPAHCEFVSANPVAHLSNDGQLLWDPVELDPKQELEMSYLVVPTEEGELGSVASVSFVAEASARTRSTRPMLKLDVAGPEKVLIGEKITLNISVTNPGTGTATGVVLLEKVPAGLSHEGGKILDNRIESIAPGETKQLAITLTGTAPGQTENYLSVSADNGLLEEVKTPIMVNSPELELEIAGDAAKYLGREATYVLKIHNPGSAPAKDVKLIAALPKNMKFVSTNNLGQYDPTTHQVRWELVELPDNVAPGEIELVLLPAEMGEGRLSLRGEGAHELACEVSKNIVVDGLAALSFEVKSLSDPVEVGKEATYEIRLSNRGTKPSANIHVAIEIPPTMKITSGDGPTHLQQSVAEVGFERLASLAPQQEAVYTIKAVCSEPGDHRIRVKVSSDDLDLLAKEESTRVYH